MGCLPLVQRSLPIGYQTKDPAGSENSHPLHSPVDPMISPGGDHCVGGNPNDLVDFVVITSFPIKQGRKGLGFILLTSPPPYLRILQPLKKHHGKGGLNTISIKIPFVKSWETRP